MSKALKPKKEKVPKITEEEYARYISSLRKEEERTESAPPPIQTGTEIGKLN